MAWAPLDLREWAEWLAIHVCRYPGAFPARADEFTRESLEALDDIPRLDWLEEILEDIDDHCSRNDNCTFDDNKPDKQTEWLIERSNLLDEITDTLDQAGFTGDKLDETIQQLLDDLAEAQDELEGLKAPALVLPDGLICLQDSKFPRAFYPLGGNHLVAFQFRREFHQAQKSDVGRKLWRIDGALQMENLEQMQARLAGNDRAAVPVLVETTKRATYWRLPSGIFQATKPGASAPTGPGGYFELSALKRLKGDL